jgi:hypothetical protein
VLPQVFIVTTVPGFVSAAGSADGVLNTILDYQFDLGEADDQKFSLGT